MATRTGRREDRRTIGYAVIGLGHIAQTAVLPAFEHARESSRLVALVSGDPGKRKALADRLAVPAFRYEDLDDVLARDDVDAVYVAPELIEFSRCIVEGRDPEPDGREGLADVRIIEAALRSAREHRPVPLEPVERRRRPTAAQIRHRPSVKPPEPVHAGSPDQ